MGGFFGAFSSTNCKYDVFFGTDYHSHLGTKIGGLVFYEKDAGYQRQIHSIENTPFRSKFENASYQTDHNGCTLCRADDRGIVGRAEKDFVGNEQDRSVYDCSFLYSILRRTDNQIG